ncbi:hypothetical protein LPJ63_001901 [Coemansia sp. RSA 2711]|nr:hypothetical protein LPJ63_001901 [Coemansia sp. RSA 2711]
MTRTAELPENILDSSATHCEDLARGPLAKQHGLNPAPNESINATSAEAGGRSGTPDEGTVLDESSTQHNIYFNSELRSHLETNTAWVVDRAQPADAASKALADEVALTVATHLESLITGAEQPEEVDTVSALAQSDESRMAEHARAVVPWLREGGILPVSASTTYEQISTFMLLVAQLLKRELAGHTISATGAGAQRLILPYDGDAAHPNSTDDGYGSDSGTEIGDMAGISAALRCCPVASPVEVQPGFSYNCAFAAVAVNRDSTAKGEGDAFAQLFGSSRSVYYCQPDRRFIWGLVCCGSKINVCIFSNYRAFASPAIDMTDKAGRSELVRLLVGWSLCDNDRLGYDDTIVWDSDLQCYEISVPCANRSGESVLYYASTLIAHAGRLFERHCRCFLATSSRPGAPVTEDSPLVPDCVIKDTWMERDRQLSEGVLDMESNCSEGSGSSCWPPEEFDLGSLTERSEIGILRKIDARLKCRADLNGRYPRILDGGWVFLGSDTQLVLDSTRLILGDLDSAQQSRTPFCVHMRYAMTPIGEPLGNVRSVPELIVILHDVMRCHAALYNECRILHRDISDSNILIVRPKSGGVHGMLIDYDYAIDVSAPRQLARPEQIGTVPFISIGNLERLPIPRTQLDDWESVIYLICWLGVFGINDESRIAGGNLPDRLDYIIKCAEHSWIDPFVKRVPYADQISNDLLKVLQRFADSAQNML